MKECTWVIEYDGEQWTVDGEPVDNPAHYMRLQFKATHHHEAAAQRMGVNMDVYSLLWDLSTLDMDSRDSIAFNARVAGLIERASEQLHG